MKTGKVIVKRLKLVDRATNAPILGGDGAPIYKLNSSSDPAYIPPYYDNTICGDVQQTTTLLDICFNIITNYVVECGTNGFHTLRTQYNFSDTNTVQLQILKNGGIVHDTGLVQIVAGNSYMSIPATITGDIVLRYIVKGCTKVFAYSINCITPTTTQSPATTTPFPTTTLPPPTTTVILPVSADFTIGTIDCNAAQTTTASPCTAVFSLTENNNCDNNRIYTVLVNTISGSPSNIQYGWSTTNNYTTVTNWGLSPSMQLSGTGTTRYIFVSYNNGCIEMVGSTSKICPIPPTTTPVPTTTPTPTTTPVPTTTPTPTTTPVPTTTPTPTTTVAVTTTPTPTTTVSPCAGVVINSITPSDGTHSTVAITTALSSVRWIIKKGGVDFTTENTATPSGGTFNITHGILESGVEHVIYVFPLGCSGTPGTGLAFTYTPITTTAAPTTTDCSRAATTANSGTISWNGTTLNSLAAIQNYVANVGGEAKTSQDVYFESATMEVGTRVFAGTTGCSRAGDMWGYFESPAQTAHIPFVCGHYAVHIVAGVVSERTLVSC